jgi:DNA polymerase-3 subunit gamma/tau
MFENIIAQPVTDTIKNDIIANTLPPSILFSGSAASAKGSAALELARVLCCEDENPGQWSCKCKSCAHHRTLSHPDLVCIGPRNFYQEILAAQSLFLADSADITRKTFFLRAIRKLLLRFSSVIWEGESKSTAAKFDKLLEQMNDDLDDLTMWDEKAEKNKTEKKFLKLIDGIVANARKLENDGIPDTIPVFQIRNAAYWLRTTPNGKRKILIIENSEKMNDAARNSLLKILEEPPESASIILTSSKPETLLQTILSRVRNYVFVKRSREAELAVISRVFHDSDFAKQREAEKEKTPILSQYLESLLPVSGEKLYHIAAYFLSSVAACTLINLHKKNISNEQAPAPLLAIGKYASPIAAAAELGRPANDIKTIVATVRSAAEKFETRILYISFLEKIYTVLGESFLTISGDALIAAIAYRQSVQRAVEESRVSVEVYKQQIEAALEHLSFSLIDDFTHTV